MTQTQLQRLLRAKRTDLLDGFPARLALKALSADGTAAFKLSYLNSLLEQYHIDVAAGRPKGDLLTGFKTSGILGGCTFTDGSIEVYVSATFFKKAQVPSPLERSLRFQSLVAHELVHRKQFQEKVLHADGYRSDDDLSSEEYLNDGLELQAMAAEVAHDLAVGALLGEELTTRSPRLADLEANARLLTPASLQAFGQNVGTYLRP